MFVIPSLHLRRACPRTLIARLAAFNCLVFALVFSFVVKAEAQLKFQRIPTQFIAALGDPEASFGSGAETWAIWEVDPGPRGVWLKSFEKLQQRDGENRPHPFAVYLSWWWQSIVRPTV